MMPLPPHAQGESNFEEIHKKFIDFLGNAQRDPIFVHPVKTFDLKAARKTLDRIINHQLLSRCDVTPFTQFRPIVTSLDQLFVKIKSKSCEFRLEDARLLLDQSESFSEIPKNRCDFHIKTDSRHCCLLK